jgi:hypothetical protein
MAVAADEIVIIAEHTINTFAKVSFIGIASLRKVFVESGL